MKNILKTIILLLVFVQLNAQKGIESEVLLQNDCKSTKITVNETTTLIPTTFLPPDDDTDGDWIPDVIENGYPDGDNDGIPNYLDLDSDNDGISDQNEGDGDIDQDGIPNFLDLDSDGDGILDQNDDCYEEPGVPPLGCTTDRKVFWIHGFEGDGSSWSKVSADVMDRFQASSKIVDYSNFQHSLNSAANNAKNDIKNHVSLVESKERNFIIAHSLGGIVTRQMEQLYDENGNKVYNGFISLGTPHQGAGLANMYANNLAELENILSDACSSLTMGPSSDIFSNIPLARTLVLFNVNDGLLNMGCDLLGDNLDNIALFLLPGVESELNTENIEANVPEMHTDHRATFYGVEDDGGSLAARFAGAFLKKPNSYEVYGADESDMVGIAMYQDVLNFYESRRSFWDLSSRVEFTSGEIILGILYRNIANDYTKGVNWLYNMNDTYKRTIEATKIELVQSGCICEEENNVSYSGSNIDCSDPSSFGGDGICYPSYSVNITHHESDGFITTESAMNGPGMNYTPEKMLHTNHLQMRNNEAMRQAVNAIFINGLGREYFKTDER